MPVFARVVLCPERSALTVGKRRRIEAGFASNIIPETAIMEGTKAAQGTMPIAAE